jgi:hypothetical protein
MRQQCSGFMFEASKLLAFPASEYWKQRMANEPLFAASLGDNPFHCDIF